MYSNNGNLMWLNGKLFRNNKMNLILSKHARLQLQVRYPSIIEASNGLIPTDKEICRYLNGLSGPWYSCFYLEERKFVTHEGPLDGTYIMADIIHSNPNVGIFVVCIDPSNPASGVVSTFLPSRDLDISNYTELYKVRFSYGHYDPIQPIKKASSISDFASIPF